MLLVAKIGEDAFVDWCAALLTAKVSYDDPASPSLAWLGGAHGASELLRGAIDVRGQDYWPRVWAARGLLHVYQAGAEEAVLSGLHDPAWRVREMCVKVARRHRIASAEPFLARLLDDSVSRVRAAAEAALTASARSPE